MEDLKAALAVHFNFPLQSISLYITFKHGIAPAGEHFALEVGRFGECYTYTEFACLGAEQPEAPSVGRLLEVWEHLRVPHKGMG